MNIAECQYKNQTQYFLIPPYVRTYSDAIAFIDAKIQSTREACAFKDFVRHISSSTLTVMGESSELTTQLKTLPSQRFILTLRA